MTTLFFKKELIKIGDSKAIVVPSNWAKEKEEVGVVAFDLKQKEDRELYHQTQEYILDKLEEKNE